MTSEYTDDEDDIVFKAFDNVQWYWDEANNQLMYKSVVERVEKHLTTGILGSVDFKDNLDLNEQQRFRKRIQRKYGPNDVVTLQDIKDVVLFTSPHKVQMPAVINILHLPAAERLIRALIMYTQYYLQVLERMAKRTEELQTKIRTPNSDKNEKVFREDLQCLRLLVGKEYCAYLIGSNGYAKYHHMGLKKEIPSLTKKERLTFEAFLRIAIQIVWIALGRKSFKQIEIEIHRIFKSYKFNWPKHKMDLTTEHHSHLHTHISTDISTNILTGDCNTSKQKVKMMSPVMDEVQCVRDIDYRLFGIGVIRFPKLEPRLAFLESALSLPEKSFKKAGIFMGILGDNRNGFDSMLNEIIPVGESSTSVDKSKKQSSKIIQQLCRKQATGSKHSRKSGHSVNHSMHRINVLELPSEEETTNQLGDFPSEIIKAKCDPFVKTQRIKWIRTIARRNKQERMLKI